MGVYSEYLERQLDFEELSAERKRQLGRIGEIRGGRDVLVYAADLDSTQAPISVGYADLLPINDQLANLSGDKLDLILETPGGSGEVAEDIVDLLRKHYEDIAVIVPGTAKSAGTLMVMAATRSRRRWRRPAR
jgi:ClpP class serine protease